MSIFINKFLINYIDGDIKSFFIVINKNSEKYLEAKTREPTSLEEEEHEIKLEEIITRDDNFISFGFKITKYLQSIILNKKLLRLILFFYYNHFYNKISFPASNMCNNFINAIKEFTEEFDEELKLIDNDQDLFNIYKTFIFQLKSNIMILNFPATRKNFIDKFLKLNHLRG
jgi:hypothetical protein